MHHDSPRSDEWLRRNARKGHISCAASFLRFFKISETALCEMTKSAAHGKPFGLNRKRIQRAFLRAVAQRCRTTDTLVALILP